MAILIHPDGTEEHVTPINGKRYSLKEMQKHVGGLIQQIPRTPTSVRMFVNEEGLLLRLPLNVSAMIRVRKWYPNSLVGRALLLEKGERF